MIEQDTHPISKVLRKIEWLAERDRAVKGLNEVQSRPGMQVSLARQSRDVRRGRRSAGW